MHGLPSEAGIKSMAGSHHFLNYLEHVIYFGLINLGLSQTVLYFAYLLIVENSLNRAEGVGSIQEPKGIMDILSPTHGHVMMSEKFFKQRLHARDLGIPHTGGGIARHLVVTS